MLVAVSRVCAKYSDLTECCASNVSVVNPLRSLGIRIMPHENIHVQIERGNLGVINKKLVNIAVLCNSP